jgi:hypothetical protein
VIRRRTRRAARAARTPGSFAGCALAIAAGCALAIAVGCAGTDARVLSAGPGSPDAALTSPLVEATELDETAATLAPSEPPSEHATQALETALTTEATGHGEVTAADSLVEAEVWLKGSTHVHARASGDSSEPADQVIAWYEDRRYDFIVLTDHNRVSELDEASDTRGLATLRDPRAGLIVFAGIELTHNPVGCQPIGDPEGRCRIHVNLLGPTARPTGRIEWAERRSHARLDMYRAAQVAQSELGGVAQINHPQWLWGMTPELLVELARRGTPLIEIANSAFSLWNAGDATHPSTEALWDAALGYGVTLWGVASDDAHDYRGHGKYPPGGGWVVVRARRNPAAILAALSAGRFYASNGVVLSRAEVVRGELVVAVDPAASGRYTIDFIENGRRVDSVRRKLARRAVPAVGYLRAVVIRDDGKRAWVQPVRR